MLRSNIPNQQLEDALPVLDALIYDEYARQPDLLPFIFNMKTDASWGVQTTTVAGIKAAVQKNEGENVEFDDPIEGFAKTYQHVTYAIACSFSQELVEYNRLSMVEDTYRSLGKAMFQTRQVTGFGVINDGFTDTGPDSSSLFNTAHSMIGGHAYANRPATEIALSIAGMREMEVDVMRQVDHRNINIALMPTRIWAPPELSQQLTELIGSPDRPDTANRAVNTFTYGGKKYMAVVSPFLTSASAWGALTDPTDHSLRFYDRITPQTETWQDKPSGDINTKIRCRFVPSYSDFIGTWGTTG